MALKNLLDWIVTETLQVTPKASLSLTGAEDGMLAVKGGILSIYDATRVKWLSVQRQTLVFGRSGATKDQYLNFASGGVSSKSGYRLPRNACIVSFTVQASTQKNYSIHIRKDDGTANIATLAVAGTYGVSETSTNTNFNTNNYLQCYLEYNDTGVGVYDPIVMIELAWRM